MVSSEMLFNREGFFGLHIFSFLNNNLLISFFVASLLGYNNFIVCGRGYFLDVFFLLNKTSGITMITKCIFISSRFCSSTVFSCSKHKHVQDGLMWMLG